MTDANTELSPRTRYVVCASANFYAFNLQVLLDYYQPMMSPHTLGLFLALRQQISETPLVINAQPLSSLLMQVNEGFIQVKEGLAQLEGLRLLKTYRSDSNHDSLILELQPTLTPVEFINDDLLSVLCLQMVGAEQFKKLGQQAKAYQLDLSNYHNVSHSFFDVFKVDQASQSIDDPVIQQSRITLDELSNQRVERNQLPDNDFDFHFLAQQLADQGVSAQELQEYRHLILTEHLVYGFDELTIAKLLAQSVDLVSGKLDIDRFKILVRAQQSPKEPSQFQGPAKPLDNAAVSSPANNDFSSQEQALIKACTQARPLDFLTQLKQQTGNGYVSPAEKNTVERLVSNLNPAAVNVLIWYIIGERGNASLSANFADAIANNWLQQGVSDAASALKAAKDYQKNRQSLQSPRKKTYRRKNAVHEKLPKWAQPGYQEKHEEASPEQAAAMRRLLMQGEQQDKHKRGEKDESSK